MEAGATAKVTLVRGDLIVLVLASLLELNAAALSKANPYSSFKKNTSEGPHVFKLIHGEINFVVPVKFRWS
jgi:hypothetical protein